MVYEEGEAMLAYGCGCLLSVREGQGCCCCCCCCCWWCWWCCCCCQELFWRDGGGAGVVESPQRSYALGRSDGIPGFVKAGTFAVGGLFMVFSVAVGNAAIGLPVIWLVLNSQRKRGPVSRVSPFVGLPDFELLRKKKRNFQGYRFRRKIGGRNSLKQER